MARSPYITRGEAQSSVRAQRRAPRRTAAHSATDRVRRKTVSALVHFFCAFSLFLFVRLFFSVFLSVYISNTQVPLAETDQQLATLVRLRHMRISAGTHLSGGGALRTETLNSDDSTQEPFLDPGRELVDGRGAQLCSTQGLRRPPRYISSSLSPFPSFRQDDLGFPFVPFPSARPPAMPSCHSAASSFRPPCIKTHPICIPFVCRAVQTPSGPALWLSLLRCSSICRGSNGLQCFK